MNASSTLRSLDNRFEVRLTQWEARNSLWVAAPLAELEAAFAQMLMPLAGQE